jgi:hypothetical protein
MIPPRRPARDHPTRVECECQEITLVPSPRVLGTTAAGALNRRVQVQEYQASLWLMRIQQSWWGSGQQE